MIDTASDAHREQFDQLGYVVVRKAIDVGLIQSAVHGVEALLERARAGEFGDQFRWIDQQAKVPAFVSDLFSEDKYTPVFGELLDSVMLPFTESLLHKQVRCSWLLMLTSGAGEPYSVALHRDNNELGGERESELLELYNMKQCYFQAPLLPNDSFLQVVPGSHCRLATEAEVTVSRSNTASLDVAGLETIELQPGDVIYRQTNMIHQGWNPAGLPRWTLVSGFWADELPMQPIEEQDFALIGNQEFIRRLPARCKVAAERYLQAYEQHQAQACDSS